MAIPLPDDIEGWTWPQWNALTDAQRFYVFGVHRRNVFRANMFEFVTAYHNGVIMEPFRDVCPFNGYGNSDAINYVEEELCQILTNTSMTSRHPFQIGYDFEYLSLNVEVKGAVGTGHHYSISQHQWQDSQIFIIYNVANDWMNYTDDKVGTIHQIPPQGCFVFSRLNFP